MLAVIQDPTSSAAQNGPITLTTLLEEMVNRTAIAQWPDPAYTCRQFSSYDRGSVGRDQPGWFANMDTGQYIRVETNSTRIESVMFDAVGPGCIGRWWAGGTTPQMGPPGTIRIYLDDADEPVFTGTMDTLVKPDWLVGPPLASIRSIGRNFYLPIPYARHCKITYDRPPLTSMDIEANRHWYVIDYRTYPAGTPMHTFTMEELRQARPLLDEIGRRLLAPADEVLNATWVPAKSQQLNTGQSMAQEFSKSGVLQKVSVQLQAPDLAQALRSTVLVASFDGEQTIWCPVGDFFGSGVGLNPYRDWWREVDRNGVLTCYWLMPFEQSCRIELVNFGQQPVNATLGPIARGSWEWNDRSLHFHTNWRQETGIQTKKAEGTTDWNYLQAQGRGIYAGDTLALHNGAAAWWGEGDEKIFVDGESFPSHFGTGSEDYYGYSFGDLGTFFEAPFHAEPRWEGNRHPGFVTVTRSRSLDAIPFARSIEFDLEIWHWEATQVAYAAATYWYARPGASSNRVPVPTEAARAISSIGK
jgi:hypothetical protein